jgi:hypothetical protein
MPFPAYFSSLVQYLNSIDRNDLVTIIQFDKLLLDTIPNLTKNRPVLNNASRTFIDILTQSVEDKENKIAAFIHDIHRDICNAADIHLFLDNFPTHADSIKLDSEAVFNTLEPAGIRCVFQVSPHAYLVCCPLSSAYSLQTRIHDMMVGDNRIVVQVIP